MAIVLYLFIKQKTIFNDALKECQDKGKSNSVIPIELPDGIVVSKGISMQWSVPGSNPAVSSIGNY